MTWHYILGIVAILIILGCLALRLYLWWLGPI
jgi:hypothetical protein